MPLAQGLVTGKNFDHRKQWLVDHYQLKQWIDREVIERWGNLFTKSLAAMATAGQSLTPAQKETVD